MKPVLHYNHRSQKSIPLIKLNNVGVTCLYLIVCAYGFLEFEFRTGHSVELHMMLPLVVVFRQRCRLFSSAYPNSGQNPAKFAVQAGIIGWIRFLRSFDLMSCFPIRSHESAGCNLTAFGKIPAGLFSVYRRDLRLCTKAFCCAYIEKSCGCEMCKGA